MVVYNTKLAKPFVPDTYPACDCKHCINSLSTSEATKFVSHSTCYDFPFHNCFTHKLETFTIFSTCMLIKLSSFILPSGSFRIYAASKKTMHYSFSDKILDCKSTNKTTLLSFVRNCWVFI